MITLCHGCAIGWLSPALPYLQSKESLLVSGPLTLTETSWIGSYFSIGAVLGNCVFGVLSNYIGLKNTTCILCVPNLVGFIVVIVCGWSVSVRICNCEKLFPIKSLFLSLSHSHFI